MSLSVRPLHPIFAGEATGIDLRLPLAPGQADEIEAAMDRYGVLVFPGQTLSDEQQLAFSRSFGALETPTRASLRSRLGSAQIADVSNLDQQNRLLEVGDVQRMFALGNLLWHTDSSFKPIPAKYSMLSAHVVPEVGGNTEFADMRAAYDALPDETKAEIADLEAAHAIAHSRAIIGLVLPPEEQAKLPQSTRPLVQRHPGSGRMTLVLASHASHILGRPVPEGRVLLLDLMEFATQRQFVYEHRWRVGDLVVWDNRCTMHRARPFPANLVRDVRRTTVMAGTEPLRQSA